MKNLIIAGCLLASTIHAGELTIAYEQDGKEKPFSACLAETSGELPPVGAWCQSNNEAAEIVFEIDGGKDYRLTIKKQPSRTYQTQSTHYRS